MVFGLAAISNLSTHTSENYNAYAFGGGLEYRLLRRVTLRLPDVEEQKCPNYAPHTLSPIAITIGAAYSF